MFIAFLKYIHILNILFQNSSRIPLQHITSNIEIVFSQYYTWKYHLGTIFQEIEGLRQDIHLEKLISLNHPDWHNYLSTSSVPWDTQHTFSNRAHIWPCGHMLRSWVPIEIMEIFLYKAWPTGTWPGRGYSLRFQSALQEIPYLDLSDVPPLNLFSNKHKSLEKVLRVVSVNIEKIAVSIFSPSLF